MATAAAPGLRLIGGGDDASGLHLVGKREIGRRLVGITTVLGVLALGVLLGLAVFHSELAEGQYRLAELDGEMQVERQRLIELQFQLESLHAPSEVELIAEGVLGLVSVAAPTDVTINPEHIDATARVEDDSLRANGNDWLETKTLLVDD